MKGRQLVIVGAILLLIGAALPWASVTSIFGKISRAGYEGDGRYTGGIGLLLLLGALLSQGKPGRRYSVASSVFAVIAGLIALMDLTQVSSLVTEANSEAGVWRSVGIGLYVTAIGALLAFIGGWMRVAPEPVASSGAVQQE